MLLSPCDDSFKSKEMGNVCVCKRKTESERMKESVQYVPALLRGSSP